MHRQPDCPAKEHMAEEPKEYILTGIPQKQERERQMEAA